jgi:hypothetical protein
MIETLKRDLPNFPPEVLSEWLEPYAKSEGWPPAHNYEQLPHGRWAYLLCLQPLNYWRALQWRKVELHVSIHDLSKSDQEKVVAMVLAAVAGQSNIYSISIPNLKERFFSVVAYLAEHGSLPKPPVIIKDAQGLNIVDGHHRMAAYFYCYGYFKLDLDASVQLNTKENQACWIAESDTPFNPDRLKQVG